MATKEHLIPEMKPGDLLIGLLVTSVLMSRDYSSKPYLPVGDLMKGCDFLCAVDREDTDVRNSSTMTSCLRSSRPDLQHLVACQF